LEHQPRAVTSQLSLTARGPSSEPREGARGLGLAEERKNWVGVLGGAGGGPAVGEQLLQPVVRVSTDPRENAAQIGEGIDAQPLAGGNEPVQYCDAPASIAAEK